MNIIELAKEAGWTESTWEGFLTKFAELVRADERETHRLPKLTDEQIWQCNSDGDGGYHICVEHQNVLDFARAIEREIGFDRANLWLKRINDAVEAIRAEREWVDLTDAELNNLWIGNTQNGWLGLFRAVIAAYKEKNK